MKRLLILLCVAGFLAALPMSHLALAGKPEAKPEKVAICHVNSANDVIVDETGEVITTFGKVIVISVNAVDKHVTQHGDSTDYADLTVEDRDALEDEYGIRLPNANCYFPPLDVPPE